MMVAEHLTEVSVQQLTELLMLFSSPSSSPLTLFLLPSRVLDFTIRDPVRMDQIREVRYGPSASPTQPIPGLTPSARQRWLTIVYTQPPSSWKTLNIVALKDDDFRIWLETIAGLLSVIRGISTVTNTPSPGTSTMDRNGYTNNDEHGLRFDATGGVIGITGDKDGLTTGTNSQQRSETLFDQADKDGDSRISYEEAFRVCKRMGMVVDDVAKAIRESAEVSPHGFHFLRASSDFNLILDLDLAYISQ
jgi:hypothetical protein